MVKFGFRETKLHGSLSVILLRASAILRNDHKFPRRQRQQTTTATMSSHAIIAFIITVLCTLIQVDFQSKSLSPFDTNSWIAPTFLVVFVAYALSWATTTSNNEVQAINDPNDNKMIMSKISLFFGALASILLMIMVFPLLGWVSLVLWTICVLKTAFELVNYVFFQVLDKLIRELHGLADQREEDRLPV